MDSQDIVFTAMIGPFIVDFVCRGFLWLFVWPEDKKFYPSEEYIPLLLFWWFVLALFICVLPFAAIACACVIIRQWRFDRKNDCNEGTHNSAAVSALDLPSSERTA